VNTSNKVSKALFSAGTALRALAMVSGTMVAATMVASPAMAQDYTRGSLVGTVQDSAGAAIADATVTAKSNEQGFEQTVTTGDNGGFRFNLLPTGSYTIRVMSGGKTVIEDSNVPVVAGQSNSFTFKAAASSETASNGDIVVRGKRVQTSDFAATTTGINLNVQDVVESIPIPRSQSGLILLAPGTTSGDTGFADCSDCVSIGGATIAENSYYVNGLNTTNFRTLVGNNTVPFEFYRTFDVKTGGYSAEFGRALGGVTSAVVKSGSNNFEAGAVVTYAPNFLTSDARNTFQNSDGLLKQKNDEDYRNSIQANFYASGALIKDRVFFFGLYNPRYVTSADTSVSGGYRFNNKSTDPFFGGKLDVIIADGHRLEGTFFRDTRDVTTDYVKVNSLGTQSTPAGREIATSGGNNYIIQYTGSFTKWLTLSAAYGKNNFSRVDVADSASPLVQTTLLGSVGTVSGLPVSPTASQDHRTIYRADADVYFNLLGDHHIRLGYDREDLNSLESTFYTGQYIYRYTTNYIRQRYYNNAGQFNSKQTAFYVQDSWNAFNDRLNLQLGLRNDSFNSRGVAGGSYLKIKNQWAPRLGASLDVFGDKLTKFNVFFGRYYLPVPTNTNIRLAGAENFYERRFNYVAGVTGGTFDANGVPIGQQVNSLGVPTLGIPRASMVNACPTVGPDAGALCQTVFSDGLAGPTDTLVAQGIKPMYQQEILVGVTHRMNNWTFGLQYTHRRLGETLEDVAIDAAVLKYCAAKGIGGCSSTFSGFHQYVLSNPGRDITVRLDGDCTIAGQCDVVTLKAADLGYPKPQRKYDAVEFTARKAFDGLYSLDFSYVWTNLRGNYEGSVKSDNNQDDAGLTQDFDQPGLSDGSFGTLANNRKHSFKFSGFIKPADWVSIGANLTVQSPRSFSCIGVHPTDAFAQGYGAASFFCANPLGNGGSNTSVLVPRGSAFKSDWTKNLDLGIQFPLGIGNSSFRVDVFNVFNSRAKTDLVEFGEQDSGALRRDYKFVSGYQSPRSVRFTLAMRFGGATR
jgi:hypothetical protein